MSFTIQKPNSFELIPPYVRLAKGIYWLIKLRWIAIAGVFGVTLASDFFKLNIQYIPLHSLTTGLIIENVLLLIILHYNKKKNNLNNIPFLKWIINFQILYDLLFLVVIMHFTGGIENPFYLFFIFHMVISSILLSKFNSYLITTYALILLYAQTYFEYTGVFQHYPICQYYEFWKIENHSGNLFQNKFFISETLIIFSLTSYLLVYMANTVVSLLRKQENALQFANNKLEEKDSIKNEYVLRLTHDIKGHLTAIQTNLSLFSDKNILGTLNDKQSEFIENTYNRTIRLSNFVNKLLNLTYMRLNKTIEIEIFSIHDAIKAAVASVNNIAENKSITLYFNVDSTLDKITGNQFSFEELISSLLLNSIKYTHSPGKIDLIVKDKDENILIVISDTGIGIPENEIPKIFDEFYRASNAKKTVKDGSGLGLAMVKQIVELYHGKIWVESKENEGTTFYITFPKNITMLNP